jgi:hypothetical protein
MSRMTARGMTITADAPTPWSARKAMSQPISGANAHPIEPSA